VILLLRNVTASTSKVLPIPVGALAVTGRMLSFAGVQGLALPAGSMRLTGYAVTVSVPGVEAAYPTVTLRIEAETAPGVWADLSTDLVESVGVSIKYGIDGHGPTDSVASPGVLRFGLRNDAGCSGGVLGFYSPRHPDKRPGWTFGIGVRALLTSTAVGITNKVKFRGKVYGIDPIPGRDADRIVVVSAYDGMRDLLDADVRSLATITDTDESAAIEDVLDAVAVSAQPVARVMGYGTNAMDVVFNDLEGGAKALQVIQDLTVSAHGKTFIKGDGTFVYANRHEWGSLNVVQAVLTGAELSGLDAPSSIDATWNLVRVTVHPKTVSTTPTETLHSSVIEVHPGSTREIWCDYTDPIDRQTHVGGTAVNTALVPGVDFNATVDREGIGANLNASITTATLAAFSSTGLYTLANSGTDTAFVRVNITGKAIRDLGAQTMEAGSVQNWQQVLDIDLPYQESTGFAQDLADYVENEWSTITNQVNWVEFWASRSVTLMGHALNREPGEQITVSERVTGLDDAPQVIQSVEITIVDATRVRCRWGLTPASSLGVPWMLDSGELNTDFLGL